MIRLPKGWLPNMIVLTLVADLSASCLRGYNSLCASCSMWKGSTNTL